MVTLRLEGRILTSSDIFLPSCEICKRVGEQNFVSGLDLALRLMSEGERSVLRMTARHGYGTVGSEAPPVSPGSNLEYDVALIKVGSFRPPITSMSGAERLADSKDYQSKAKKHFLLRNFKESERLYVKALEFCNGDDDETNKDLHNERIRCLNNIALVEYKLAKYTESNAACDRVLRLDKTNIKARYRLGLLLERESKYSESLSQFAAVLKAQKALKDQADGLDSEMKFQAAIRRTSKTIARVKQTQDQYRASRRQFSKAMLRRRGADQKDNSAIMPPEPSLTGPGKAVFSMRMLGMCLCSAFVIGFCIRYLAQIGM